MKLQQIGKLKDLSKHYKSQTDKLTTTELSAIYNRIIFLDCGNKQGALDEVISKHRPMLEEVVRKLTQGLENLPVDQFKYLMTSLSNLN
jgi:hypothetical protein